MDVKEIKNFETLKLFMCRHSGSCRGCRYCEFYNNIEPKDVRSVWLAIIDTLEYTECLPKTTCDSIWNEIQEIWENTID